MKKKSLYRYSDGGKIDPPIKGKPIILADPNKPYDKITNPDGYKVTRFPGDTLTNNQIVKVAEDLWTKGENYNSLSNKTLVQNGVGNVYPLSNIDIPKVKKAFDNMGWFGRTWNAMTPYSPKNTTIPQPQYEMGGKTDPPVKRKPIITTNPSDPRLKAYSDSLNLYKNPYSFQLTSSNSTPSINTLTHIQAGKVNPVEYKKALQGIIDNNDGSEWTDLAIKNAKRHINFIPNNLSIEKMGDYDYYRDFSYKKPVQPVVYQKPDPKTPTKTVEYTDPIKFKQAQQAYSDSLNIATLPVNGLMSNDNPILKKYINSYDRLAKLNGTEPSVINNKSGEYFKKPVSKPILKEEQLYPIQGAQKGNIKIQQGQQATIPEPTGQPVYGPSNGLIGYQGANGFQPTLRRDHLAKVNQADIDLLNNPEALKKYTGETPRYKYGGIYINPANKGKFNATKAATGKTTEELTHSSNPVTRKRAIFAQNAAKWKHEDGGPVKKSYNPNLASTDKGFINWYNQNTPEGKSKVPYSDKGDYDYYSFFRNGDYKSYQGGHFPDTYKRPNHQTFSNESIYSTPENPGGSWNGDIFNKVGKFKYDTGGFTDDPMYRYNKKQDLIRNPRLPLQDSINPNILQQYQNRTQVMFHPEQDFNDELEAAQLPSNQVSNGVSNQVGRQFGAANRTNIGLFSVLDPLAREISEKFDRNKQDDEYTKIMYNSRFNTPVSGESEDVKHGYKLYRYGGKTKPKILKFEDGGEIDALEKELEDSLFQEDTVVKNDKMVVEDTPAPEQNTEDEDDSFMEDILYSYSNNRRRSSNSGPVDNESIDSAAEQYNVPASILYGVWGAESGFGKVGTKEENSAGAQGHFQFTKATADHFGLKNRGNFNEEAPIAAKYLSQLKEKFGNWEDALRGYNAGPGKVKQSYKFKETNNYVQKVKQYAAQYK